MAEYIVDLDDNGVEPFGITAGEPVTVTFEENVDRVEVISDGASEVRVTNGGTVPTIGQPGDSTIAFRLPAGALSIREFPMPQDSDVVTIVSAGDAVVSVQVVR